MQDNDHTNYRGVKFALAASLFLAQSLPCLAQTTPPVFVHPHVWAPPVVPVIHQNSGSSQTTHTGTHHHWLHSNGTLPSNNSWGQSLVTPTPGTISAAIQQQSKVQTSTPAITHTWLHNTNWVNSTATTHSTQVLTGTLSSGKHTAPSINLDLSSTTATTTGGRLLGNGTVVITVGGSSFVVNSTTPLTSAERVAVQQVLQTGSQSLVIDAQGSASGGSMTVSPFLSQHLSSLVVPQGVSVTDISKTGTLNIKGNLVDDGNLYIATTNPTVGTVIINASNITVQSQGLLTDLLPAGSVFTSLVPLNLNLTINATNNISNAGSIISAGALNLNAGGAITNAPVNGSSPIIQAASNINLTPGSGNITNNGLIASTHGNINIASTIASNNININAANGTFQAVNGNISVRDASYTGSGNIDLNGGNYLSQNLNLYSGLGAITGFTGQISGNLNTQAAVEHLTADSTNLSLGNNSISGDPTFANSGNITISGPNTFGEAVSIVAGGNISLGNGTGSITTTGTGNQVIMISGATIAFNGVTPTGANITGSPAGVTTNGISVTLGAGTGNIDLSTGYAGGGAAVITTTGGNVTLLANNGTVLLPTGATQAVNTSNTSGSGGSIKIIAGSTATGSAVIQAGNLLTGGSTTSGSVTLTTAAPQITNGGGIAFFNTNGSATTTSGGATASTFGAGSTTTGAQITTGTITTAGGGGIGNASSGGVGGSAGGITIQSGGAINVSGSLEAFGAGGGGGGIFSGGAGGSGGGVSVTSNGVVSISGDVNTSGGGGGGAGAFGSAGAGGNAGSITINTTDTLTINGVVLAANGGNGGSPGSGGGGGSFGGAGGGGGHNGPGNGFNGGGGTFGGGGGGAGSNISSGGGGGGGGYSGAGGGGGGDSGGGASGGGGGGGGNGGAGGVGGTGTGAGGSGAGGGGNGGNSENGGSGGNGGAGGTQGGGGGSGGTGSGGTGGNGGASGINVSFGVGGSGGGNAGTGTGSGGVVSLTGSTVVIDGTIPLGPFNNQSINALGSGGSITISQTQAGSSFTVGTSPIPPGGSLGSLTATASITINGTTAGTGSPLVVSSGTFTVASPTPTPSPPAAPFTIIVPALTQPYLAFYVEQILEGQITQSFFNQQAEQIGTKIATDYTPGTTAYALVSYAYSQMLANLPSINRNFFASTAEQEVESTQFRTFMVDLYVASDPMLYLNDGSVVVVGTKAAGDPVVTTPDATASIPIGGAAIVAKKGTETFVYDLHDDLRTGPIKVVANKKEFRLSAGTAAIITRNLTASFASLNPSKIFGYRNVRSTDLGDGMKVYIYDFSIIDALSNVPKVRNMLKSNDPEQRAIAWKMIKNANILADMTGSNYSAGH